MSPQLREHSTWRRKPTAAVNSALTLGTIKTRETTCKALAPSIGLVEDLLGRALQEDENISVRAFKGEMLNEAPTGEAREEAFRRLLNRVDTTARRAEGVLEAEIDAAIDEATDYVRR